MSEQSVNTDSAPYLYGVASGRLLRTDTAVRARELETTDIYYDIDFVVNCLLFGARMLFFAF